MDDDSGISWDRIVILIFVIASILVLLLMVYFIFLLPALKQ
jgi:hypothetical protein